jgi:hypothetical protein
MKQTLNKTKPRKKKKQTLSSTRDTILYTIVFILSITALMALIYRLVKAM